MSTTVTTYVVAPDSWRIETDPCPVVAPDSWRIEAPDSYHVAYPTSVVGQDVESADELTRDQASHCIDTLCADTTGATE